MRNKGIEISESREGFMSEILYIQTEKNVEKPRNFSIQSRIDWL